MSRLPDKKKCLVLLGMHRTGTSVTTRLLSYLGASLPATLMPPDRHNLLGYWESQPLRDFHDSLLSSAGSSWSDVKLFPEHWHGSETAIEFKDRALALLRTEYDDSSFFIIKDPRICRIVPFWIDVLKAFRTEPLFVISVRNPLEVVASLHTRDGFSTPHSLLLWLQHTLEAERRTRGYRRALSFYDDLLDHPTEAISTIARELSLDLPTSFSRSRTEIEGFVSLLHRHHVVSEPDLIAREDVPVWVKRAFQAFRHHKNEAELSAQCDAIWNEFQLAHRAFGPLTSNTPIDTSPNQGPTDRRSEIPSTPLAEDSNTEPTNASGLRSLQIQSRIDLTERVYRLEERQNADVETFSMLRRELEYGHRNWLEQVNDLHSDYQRRIDNARQEINHLSKDIAARDREAQQTQDELETLRAQVVMQDSEREQANQETVARDEAIARLRNELKDQEERLSIELQYLLGQFTLRLLQDRWPEENERSRIQRALGWLASLFARNKEGRTFDPRYYLARHRDVAAGRWDPWMHYLLFGRKERRRTAADNPSFARHLELRELAESDLFNEQYYAAHNPDVVHAGSDPLEHFLETGAWESRKPSEHFDPQYYLRTYPDVKPTHLNPLTHYLWLGRIGGRRPVPPPQHPSREDAMSLEVTEPSIVPEPEMRLRLDQSDINLIAFYLPQFHPFPENDRFWGKGFTEWTNVTRTAPLFDGHDQPRRPGELGYYDLRVKETQKRQIELAKQHGIHGFCYHYYWFDGTPVMNRPLEQMLDDPDLDFPFCLHWANEPWTATWDGYQDSRVLLHQDHSQEDDMAFIRHIEPALRDVRYVRLNGRPLLGIYRPGLFSDIKATVERWREYCIRAGIGELYLVATQQSFDGPVDPRDYGFDAALEFPPHNLVVPDVRDQVTLYDSSFEGFIGNYAAMKEESLAKSVPPYKLFRGIMPGFDCTARRKNASIFIDNRPDIYQEWLEGLCRYTRANLPRHERLIFLNAWNEWAEGAYLEPDQSYGYAFLNRTARAIKKFSTHTDSRTVVFLGHDAARAGAQMMLLNVIEWIAKRTSTRAMVLLGKGGELLDRYQELAEVLVLEGDGQSQRSVAEQEGRIREFVQGPVDAVYVNTVAAGAFLPLISFLNAPIITHVHELEKSIQRFSNSEDTKNLLHRSSRIIAASPPVADNLSTNHSVNPEQIDIVYEFVQPQEQHDDDAQRSMMRKRLGLEQGDVAVFGCGTLDWRKGPDLFVDVAALLREQGLSGFRFFWIGAPIQGEYEDLEAGLEARGLAPYVTFLGPKQCPRDYFLAGDIFLLSSREDPFPLVCLEAAGCGLPVVCFADAGGMPDFVQDDAGFVTPYGDASAMASSVAQLISSREERETRGSTARRKLSERHVVEIGMPEIFHILRTVAKSPPLVSIIIPSYNYDQYLEGRLASIFRQTFQDFEVIVEDDCSTDNTLNLLSRYRPRRNIRVETHSKNQGVFTMWTEGLKAASGKIMWIAEEDDLCEPTFLEELVPLFSDERVNIAYCQSLIIDDKGSVLGDYSLCFPEISKSKWLRPYLIEGAKEVKEGLAVKNFILNASGVLFLKPDVEKAGEILREYRMSGDWALYLYLLKNDAFIAYSPRKLNYHRRHSASVVGDAADTNLPIEEASRIHNFVIKNYPVDDDLKRSMTDYAYQLWLERNPGAALDEFRSIYRVDDSVSSRAGTAIPPSTL